MTLKWGCKRAFLRSALIFAVGVVLQLVVGDLDNSFLRYPWGLIIAVNYLYLLILANIYSDKWQWVRRLSDHYASASALASMVVMCIIFGFTRQDVATEGLVGALGFSRMTSSWPFNLLLLYFTTTLGLMAIDDVRHFRQRSVARLMSHVAPFVAIAAMMFGSGDKLRVTLRTSLDKTVYVGVDRNGESVELPFAITLREFRMEEYAPKLYLLDTKSETSSREFLSVESVGNKMQIGDWELSVKAMEDMAGRIPDEQEFRAMNHVGAAPAVYVVARNVVSGVQREGWVSCGSFIFEPQYLFLDNGLAIAMPRREPKHYLSRVRVEQMDGTIEDFNIEVNHPARVGAWHIYQVGYDTQRGRWSTTSVLECVRDGWSPAVAIAMWLTLAAGVAMFVTAGGRTWRGDTSKRNTPKIKGKQRKEVKL